MKVEFIASRSTRLDRLIQVKLPYIRRSFLQKLFRKKEVKVASKAKNGDSAVEVGEKISVFLPDPRKNFAVLTGCKILFENDEVIAIDKRAGLPTHAGVGTKGNTLREAAEGLLSLNLIVVHRLDADTSGVIIFAKKKEIARKLESEFKQRRVDKVYHAVVEGSLKENSGIIKSSLKKSGQKVVVVKSGGQVAETHWKVIKKTKDKTLVEIKLITGRMHQIRVHFSEAGYPVIGDRLYGNANLSGRMLLHASSLKVFNYDFQAKLPEEFMI